MAALTMDHLTGGRFVLGLGASGPQVVEGWYGDEYAKPLARTRETASAIAAHLGLEVELDDRALEMDYGTWDGTPLAEVTRSLWISRPWPRLM